MEVRAFPHADLRAIPTFGTPRWISEDPVSTLSHSFAGCGTRDSQGLLHLHPSPLDIVSVENGSAYLHGHTGHADAFCKVFPSIPRHMIIVPTYNAHLPYFRKLLDSIVRFASGGADNSTHVAFVMSSARDMELMLPESAPPNMTVRTLLFDYDFRKAGGDLASRMGRAAHKFKFQ